MPVVKLLMALYNMQTANPDSPPGRLQAALQDPEVQKTCRCPATSSPTRSLSTATGHGRFRGPPQRLVGAMRYGPIVLQLGGKGHHVPPNRIEEMVFLTALAENAQLLKATDAVLGFKVRDAAEVKQGLERLEKQANALLEENPTLKERLKKTEVGGTQYLTFSLDGGMLPWDEAPLDRFREIEATKGNIDKVVAQAEANDAGPLPSACGAITCWCRSARRPTCWRGWARGSTWPSGRNWPRCGTRRQSADRRRLFEPGHGTGGTPATRRTSTNC